MIVMSKKDLIIRVSGSNAEIENLLDEIAKQTTGLNLIPENMVIRKVPAKIRKADLQDKRSRDLMISARGAEDKIEIFIEAIVDAVDKELMLSAPSIALKVEGNDQQE